MLLYRLFQAFSILSREIPHTQDQAAFGQWYLFRHCLGIFGTRGKINIWKSRLFDEVFLPDLTFLYIYILYMYNIIYYCIYYALYIIYIATPLHYIHNVKTIFGKSLGHGGWISQYLQPFVRFLVHEGFPDFFAQDTVLRTMSVEVDWKSIAAAPPLIASALQQSTVGKFPRRQMSVQLAFLCIFEPEPVLMMQRMHCTLLCSFSPSLAFCQKQFLLRIFATSEKTGQNPRLECIGTRLSCRVGAFFSLPWSSIY